MRLDGKRIAVLCTDGVEQVELEEPWRALQAEGAVPALVSLEHGRIRAFDHLEPGDELEVDELASDVDADDFDALLLPGGVANPDRLRTDPAAVGLVRGFFAAGKPVAAICHAPWLLVEAGVLGGRTITSWPSLRTDVQNAGATWIDEDVVREPGLVTSRKPDDLPAFCRAMIDLFERGPVEAPVLEESPDVVQEASEESFPASDAPGYHA